MLITSRPAPSPIPAPDQGGALLVLRLKIAKLESSRASLITLNDLLMEENSRLGEHLNAYIQAYQALDDLDCDPTEEEELRIKANFRELQARHPNWGRAVGATGAL